MGSNEFDPKVMPSARAARAEQRRMSISAGGYAPLGILVCVSILLAAYLAVGQR